MGNPFECSVEIPMDADEYWALLADFEFETFLQNSLGSEVFQELETTEEEDADVRKVRITVPNTTMPTAVWNTALWYLGSNDFAHVNNERRMKGKRELTFTTTPPCFADTLFIRGTATVTPGEKPNTCVHSLKGETEMNSWLNVGSVIETAIVSNIKRGYEMLPEVVAGYTERKAAGKGMSDGFETPCVMVRVGETPPESKGQQGEATEPAPAPA